MYKYKYINKYNTFIISGPTKNWIAVEGNPSINSTIDPSTMNYNYKIAASAPKGVSASLEERNVFAIYVSYYIKVKLTLSGMGGEVTLKLPFILGHIDDNDDALLNNKDKVKKQCNSADGDCSTTTLGKNNISNPLTTSKIIEEDCGPEQLETTTSFEGESGSGSMISGGVTDVGMCSTSAMVSGKIYPLNKNVYSNKHEIDSIKSDISIEENDDDDDDDGDEETVGGCKSSSTSGKFNTIGQTNKQHQLDDKHQQIIESNVNVITAQVHNSAIQ